MIPVRVSHNQSIGPGVVPAGVDPAYDAQYANHKGPVAHVGANGFGRPFSVAPGPITHTQYVRHPPLTPDWSRPKTVTVFTSCSNPKRKRLGVRAMQHHDLQRVEGRAKAVYAWKAKNSTSSPLRFEICAQSTSSFSLTPSPPPPLRAIHRTPYVTGTTVLGMKYKDGVMIACDTLGTCYERAPDLEEFRSQAVCQLRFFWRNATLNRSACFFLSSSSSSRVE